MEREKMNGYVFRQIKTYELYSFERGEVESKVMDQFKIVTRIGRVTHLLKMSLEFSRMRNTLNVSWLEKCSTGESSHDLFDSIQVDRNPRKVDQSLRIKDIGLVKVQSEHRNGSTWTWEPEAERRSNYTEIFHKGRAIGEIGEFLSEVARRRLFNQVSKVEIVVVGVRDQAKRKETDKGKATDKGKGTDKAKGIAIDTGEKTEWSQTVGGFMKDARKGLRPSQQGTKSDGAQTGASKQEVKGPEGVTKKVRKQRVKGQMPTRRQPQARISKINMQKKVPGPGNTIDDAMLLSDSHCQCLILEDAIDKPNPCNVDLEAHHPEKRILYNQRIALKSPGIHKELGLLQPLPSQSPVFSSSGHHPRPSPDPASLSSELRWKVEETIVPYRR
ncbi:hypothetical protein OSB04_028995 [Centaurea solstitialis]|uniref:Uncharacterized protein n=1 Tax=Centaurea solstitialis TaxID=347529 RepID=A0AA38SGR5_9ASTR|nr:hypothetical protein OSB04_028995 [Centaurea solstitialis]